MTSSLCSECPTPLPAGAGPGRPRMTCSPTCHRRRQSRLEHERRTGLRSADREAMRALVREELQHLQMAA